MSTDTPAQDTLSGRFGGQWAFLSSPPPPPSSQHAQRSLPPSSSYIRSERGSSVSPIPTGLHFLHTNASRSSLPRNIYTPSAGGHSSATIPTQPVLIRIHSANAALHDYPSPRPPRRRPIMSKSKTLPTIEEYSFAGILNTIRQDVDEDIEGIAEILGRSRYVLADQHDSHLPPQGEIRAQTLHAVAEASSSNERLAADDVMILHEDASLVEGSQAGSAAYDLLERLRAMPGSRRMNSELPDAPRQARASMPARIASSPAVLTEETTSAAQQDQPALSPDRRTSRHLLYNMGEDLDAINCSRATPAIVSEVWLSAGADGKVMSDPPVVSEAGRHYPLYSYDESDMFEGQAGRPSDLSFRERMRRLLLLRDFRGVTTWIGRPEATAKPTSSNAESHLRDILGRQSGDRARPPVADPIEVSRDIFH